MDDKAIIEQHRPLADMVMQHGYAPKGSLPAVVALEQIYIQQGGKKVDKFCFSCVKNMFVYVYHHYYPTLITNESRSKKKHK